MAAACNSLLLSLGADLLERIADSVPFNDIAFGLRLACKPLAQQFGGSFTAVKLYEPVTQEAFAERWGSPEAWRGP